MFPVLSLLLLSFVLIVPLVSSLSIMFVLPCVETGLFFLSRNVMILTQKVVMAVAHLAKFKIALSVMELLLLELQSATFSASLSTTTQPSRKVPATPSRCTSILSLPVSVVFIRPSIGLKLSQSLLTLP